MIRTAEKVQAFFYSSVLGSQQVKVICGVMSTALDSSLRLLKTEVLFTVICLDWMSER